MKKYLVIGVLLFAGYQWVEQRHSAPGVESATVAAPANNSESGHVDYQHADSTIEKAFRQRQSDIFVEGNGVVEKVLSDDRDGAQHQRFIVRLHSGQTILIAHNIDLSSRVDSLRVGETIAFAGDYEWNDKGGVVHWTHHDPSGRHRTGWLKYEGRTYQ